MLPFRVVRRPPFSAIIGCVSPYIFPDPRKGARREILVHTHRPARFTPESPVVVVMHGKRRNAADYRDFWIGESEKRGFLVVAPEFSDAHYAHPHGYNYGAMVRADGTPAPRDEWLFPVVDAVFKDAAARAGSRCGRYFLFGHSAGGQIVHRLVTFGWSPLIERAVAANSGGYTLPLREEAFPFGLGGVEAINVDLRALFSRPLSVLLGDRDIETDHTDLPREPGAMRQGPHRFARGHHYLEVARREASRLGVDLKWRLAIAPGVAHSGLDMAPFAARELFD